MTWTATDIALLITTVTTALTAISGVVLPVFSERRSKAKSHNDLVRNEFKEAVSNLIVQMQLKKKSDEMRYLEVRKMRAALDNSSKYAPKEIEEEFEAACLSLQLLGDAAGIKTENVIVGMGSLCSSFLAYWGQLADASKDSSEEILEECILNEATAKTALSKAVRDMWKEIDLKYPAA